MPVASCWPDAVPPLLCLAQAQIGTDGVPLNFATKMRLNPAGATTVLVPNEVAPEYPPVT